MPTFDLPYRITNEKSLKPPWRKLGAWLRARTAPPQSSGSREQPSNPKLRASALIRIAIGQHWLVVDGWLGERTLIPFVSGERPDETGATWDA
jgi:hypothetical protein